jgi:hypothetical protein
LAGSRIAYDRVDSWRDAEGRVLWHADPDADHVLLHDREHEGATVGVALDHVADVDVALSNNAIERRDDRCIVPVLCQSLQASETDRTGEPGPSRQCFGIPSKRFCSFALTRA